MGFLDKSLLLAANQMMKGVGHLEQLHVNTLAKSASATMMLAGESQPVQVDVGHYELVNGPGGDTLKLRDLTCSREWMDKLADRLEPQMNIKVPKALATVLRLARVA